MGTGPRIKQCEKGRRFRGVSGGGRCMVSSWLPTTQSVERVSARFQEARPLRAALKRDSTATRALRRPSGCQRSCRHPTYQKSRPCSPLREVSCLVMDVLGDAPPSMHHHDPESLGLCRIR